MNPTNQTLPAKASGSAPSYSVDGTPAFLSLDASGNLRVAGAVTIIGPVTVSISEKTEISVTGTVSSNTLIVAVVNGKRIKVTAMSLYTAYSGGTITPILTDGNGGTTIWTFLMQAISSTVFGSNLVKSAPSFFCGTAAGNALYLNPNGQSVTYSITYFADDAT